MAGRSSRAGGRRDVVVFTTGLHPIVFLPALLCAGIAYALLDGGLAPLVERAHVLRLTVWYQEANDTALAATGFGLDPVLGASFVLLAVGSFLRALLGILYTRIRVTPTRILFESGLARSTRLAVPYERLEGVTVERGRLGRVLGYGAVTLAGATGAGTHRCVARAEELRRVIDKQHGAWLCRDLGSGAAQRRAAAR